MNLEFISTLLHKEKMLAHISLPCHMLQENFPCTISIYDRD